MYAGRLPTSRHIPTNHESAQKFRIAQIWAIRYAIMIIVRETSAVEV